MNDKQEIPHGIEYDRMNLHCKNWKNLTYWCLPMSDDSPSEYNYSKIEMYLMSKMIWLRLVVANPFSELDIPPKTPHPSGYELLIGSIGDKQPIAIISDHPFLEKASFEELFSCMSVIAKVYCKANENINSIDVNINAAIVPTTQELQGMRRRWKTWAKNCPDWLKRAQK